ncbi:MAG: DUF3310 domain-containing protein [Spirochaetaceae bacterium]|jgi:hypothetical protein|nr:DUF3310 domain-containing protein [Spirochaetaceae bacterium]
MTGDPVNRPAHYTFGKYELTDVCMDWFESDPLLWQVCKYIVRAGRKDPALEDLQKATWYLNRRIERETAAAFCSGCPHESSWRSKDQGRQNVGRVSRGNGA